MDLLTTILTCSLYTSDDALVRAIAEGPSGGNPYFVVNTAVQASPDAPSPAVSNEQEATSLAAGLASQGATLLLGLLEVPPGWLDVFGRPLANAFDPCLNIAIGTAMLSEFDGACASNVSRGDDWARRLERTNRRSCVLHKYEVAIGAVDFAYTVLFELSSQRVRIPAVADAPIFAPPSPRDWGPDRLLVTLPLAVAPATPRPASP